MDRCGKTNCSNNARPNCVGIACPRRLPAIPALQKVGFYPIRGQQLKSSFAAAFRQIWGPGETRNQLLVVEGGEAACMLGDQHRLKAAVAIARRLDQSAAAHRLSAPSSQ